MNRKLVIKISSKFFAKAAIAFMLCAFFAFSAYAAQESDARQVLENSVNSILNDIKTPAYSNPATRKEILPKIENTVKNIFDFSEFSSRTVGPKWRSFSPQQKKAFSDAFADLLFATYLNKISSYNGEKIAYTGDISDGKRVEIRTVITLSDGRQIPVAYRMLPKDGTWRVYDVIIESISLIKNYRTQFQDILNTGTPEQLIARVEAKAQEMSKNEPQNASVD